MKKTEKTARELGEMIAAEISLDGVSLSIHRDPNGWHGTVYGSSPNRVAQAQAQVSQVVQRLRASYDLKE